MSLIRRRMMLANHGAANGLVDGTYNNQITVTDGNQIAQNGTTEWEQINIPLRQNITIRTGDVLRLQFTSLPVAVHQDWYYMPVVGTRKFLVSNQKPPFTGQATVDADGEMYAIQFMARVGSSEQATFRIHLYLNNVQLF